MSDSLTADDVAVLLGVQRRTVYAYRRAGKLPEPTMIGRTPTWTRQEVEAARASWPGMKVASLVPDMTKAPHPIRLDQVGRYACPNARYLPVSPGEPQSV